MSGLLARLPSFLTRTARRYLVGAEQSWVFERPPQGWTPSPLQRASLYLHVPFCRHGCLYCPYTRVSYRKSLVEPYIRAAIAEVDWWADALGPVEVTGVSIGGGTPTLALEGVARLLEHIRRRFRLKGEICIETNPADVDQETVRRMQEMGVGLVSLGVESFQAERLDMLGRGYTPSVAERALALVAEGGFASLNANLMFALPGQTTGEVLADLERAAKLGADQVTAYPLFTFPYTALGEYLHLAAAPMPGLRLRRAQYRAIQGWCRDQGFERVSLWSFKRGGPPRLAPATRDHSIGIGPGAGSHLSDGYSLNTFDLYSWMRALGNGHSPVALRMPFAARMSGWWWLYWRLFDTRIPLEDLDAALGRDAARVRRWLKAIERLGLAVRKGVTLELTEAGSFWLHLVQNHFTLDYVNTLWTRARREPWPLAVPI